MAADLHEEQVSLRKAACHCGALNVRCAGEPSKVSLCHCLDCQRRTGSPFGVAVFYPRDRVEVDGEARQFTRDSASGNSITFHFCGTCGANLFWEPARMPHLIAVAIGAFADPAFPMPSQSVWTRDKHHWLDLPAAMSCFEVNPPPKPVPAA